MPTGVIKSLVPEKGFGFIEVENGNGKDLFFHHSEVHGGSLDNFREGDKVTFGIGRGRRGPCAISVRSAK